MKIECFEKQEIMIYTTPFLLKGLDLSGPIDIFTQ